MGPDGAPQFVPPVHAVKVSTDDLVYVADRGGRLVQVFTIAGKFVNQVFIGRECHVPDCGKGQTASGLAFSASTFSYAIAPRGSITFAPRDSNGQSPF